MTGEQFKTLIEQFTDNGKVDTIPELMQRIGQIPDDMTLEEYISGQAKKATSDYVDENVATNSDIDEIFPDLIEE
jgi:hypothetical protein